jgi:hypothetical protein
MHHLKGGTADERKMILLVGCKRLETKEAEPMIAAQIPVLTSATLNSDSCYWEHENITW